MMIRVLSKAPESKMLISLRLMMCRRKESETSVHLAAQNTAAPVDLKPLNHSQEVHCTDQCAFKDDG